MIVAFSISPGGVGGSVGDLVADCVRIVRDSGLPCETNAMFTNIEGEWDEVMPVIKRCMDHVAEHAPRVGLVLKADHRPGHEGDLQGKVERLEGRLGGTGEER